MDPNQPLYVMGHAILGALIYACTRGFIRRMNRPSLGGGFPPSAVRVANQAADFPMGCATAGNPELREAPQTCWKLEVEQFVIRL